jgi:heme/copper-type cytochrome/quinol oxidase subunit 2
MASRLSSALFGGSILAGVILVAACAGQAEVVPVERTIYMAAVEPKGGVNVDQEPFPSEALPSGGGYALKEPDGNGRWEVETYRWDPSTIVVNQGEVVTLEMIGVNGKQHTFEIEGYDLAGVVRRGYITRLTFTADTAGIFRLICATHKPSMQANIVVLPAGG